MYLEGQQQQRPVTRNSLQIQQYNVSMEFGFINGRSLELLDCTVTVSVTLSVTLSETLSVTHTVYDIISMELTNAKCSHTFKRPNETDIVLLTRQSSRIKDNIKDASNAAFPHCCLKCLSATGFWNYYIMHWR